mgnify:CR=1 FL=1
MARINGVDLPREKRVEIGLTYIYGIGLTTSKKILAETGVDPDVRCNDLTEDDLTKLRDYIQNNLTVEGDLPSSLAISLHDALRSSILWTVSRSCLVSLP